MRGVPSHRSALDQGFPMQWFRNARKLRALLMFTGLMLAGALVLLTGLVVLLRQEPGWYVQAAQVSGPERQIKSGNCVNECVHIYDDCEDDKGWQGQLNDEEMNAFFE